MKNSNDTIRNRTRYLLAYSAVPQPTAPSRAPYTERKVTFCVCLKRKESSVGS